MQILIEIKLKPVFGVRAAKSLDDSVVKHWDELSPGGVNHDTNWSYKELFELGVGYHEIELKIRPSPH